MGKRWQSAGACLFCKKGNLMNLEEHLFGMNFHCRVCEHSGWQMPPSLYVGNLKSDIVIVSGVATRLDDIAPDFDFQSPEELLEWEKENFEHYPSVGKYEKVFGKDFWYHYTFTYSVRCRDKLNSPTEQMKIACGVWTRRLTNVHKKGVVLVGSIAKNQILPNHDFEQDLVLFRNQKTSQYFLHMKDLDRMTPKEIEDAKKSFDRLKEKVNLNE